MPKPRKIEIYSIEDFKKAPLIDRIRMYMIEPERFDLNDRDFQYYRKLNQAFQIVFEEVAEGAAIKMIQMAVEGCENLVIAKKVLADCFELFGPMVKKNKDMRRAILVEKMYELAAKAEKNAHWSENDENGVPQMRFDKDWMEIAANLYEKAGKFEGLDKHDVPILNPDDLEIPELIITPDPQVFIEAQSEPFDEYEEEADDE
jgi:hypothetical protein